MHTSLTLPFTTLRVRSECSSEGMDPACLMREEWLTIPNLPCRTWTACCRKLGFCPEPKPTTPFACCEPPPSVTPRVEGFHKSRRLLGGNTGMIVLRSPRSHFFNHYWQRPPQSRRDEGSFYLHDAVQPGHGGARDAVTGQRAVFIWLLSASRVRTTYKYSRRMEFIALQVSVLPSLPVV